MRLTLAAFDERLRPMSKADIYRRAARRAHIDAMMQRVAKHSERALPPDERRQVIDLAELGRASLECAVACVCAVPFAALWMFYLYMG